MSHIQKCYHYESKVTTASDWEAIDLGFASKNLRLALVTGTVNFSIDGTTTGGLLDSNDPLIVLSGLILSRIWVKGSGTVRVYAWTNNQ